MSGLPQLCATVGPPWYRYYRWWTRSSAWTSRAPWSGRSIEHRCARCRPRRASSRDVLVAAHAAAVDEHTDDAGLAERIGVVVHTVAGEEAALKITRPFDLAVAELLLDLEVT